MHQPLAQDQAIEGITIYTVAHYKAIIKIYISNERSFLVRVQGILFAGKGQLALRRCRWLVLLEKRASENPSRPP